MSNDFTRRDLLKSSGLILGTGILAPQLVFADVSKPTPSSSAEPLVRLSLNENPYGPKKSVSMPRSRSVFSPDCSEQGGQAAFRTISCMRHPAHFYEASLVMVGTGSPCHRNWK